MDSTLAQFGWYGNRNNQRLREASVEIKADWTMLEEIEFSRLAKLRMEVSDPEDMYARIRVRYWMYLARGGLGGSVCLGLAVHGVGG
jgi:hypothetical protein